MEDQITQLLLAQFAEAEIALNLDGNRVHIDIVHPAFADLSRVKKQQAVYACITDLIASGDLHAVTIRADAPAV